MNTTQVASLSWCVFRLGTYLLTSLLAGGVFIQLEVHICKDTSGANAAGGGSAVGLLGLAMAALYFFAATGVRVLIGVGVYFNWVGMARHSLKVDLVVHALLMAAFTIGAWMFIARQGC